MQSPCAADSLVVEAVSFPAGPYRLEGELAYPEQAPPRAAVVIAGPHPLLGGNLHNNVVRGLGEGLALHGLATLRFNYRGVGRSEGPPVDVAGHIAQFWRTSHIPEEEAYPEDLHGALVFLRRVLGEGMSLAVVGYSFGCSLVPQAALRNHLSTMVLIAPTVGRHDYTAFTTLSQPLLVIASEDDFAADAAELRAWFNQLHSPRQLIQQRLDDHFFRAYEPWLVETVAAFLDTHWPAETRERLSA
jgi:alpha/beta superfamily hydrolase